MNIRTIAVEVLLGVQRDKRSLNTLLPKAQDKVSDTDKALLQELVFGCCRWYFYLEKLTAEQLERPLHRKDNETRLLLILGAYQLLFMRIPDHAAINETVDAAKELDQAKTKNLINAILRNIAREKEQYKANNEDSFPDWFSAKLRNNWPEQAESAFEASNQRPPMTLRVNKQHLSQQQYLDILEKDAIEALPCTYSDKGVVLKQACDVRELPLFEQGHISVQDEAAQLSTTLLDLAPNLRVLDACAAPGGKTCAMLEQEPSLDLVALDHDGMRLKRVEENLSRIHAKAQLIKAEAENTETWFDGQAFDRILLDAPCSATGVIRRHPDIKLLRDPADLKKLAELQLQLLLGLWDTLKSGGRLVYATCSIFPQENARIIERFLAQTSDAELLPIEAQWGIDTGFGRQLFPQTGEEGHDGFFYSTLLKKHQPNH